MFLASAAARRRLGSPVQTLGASRRGLPWLLSVSSVNGKSKHAQPTPTSFLPRDAKTLTSNITTTPTTMANTTSGQDDHFAMAMSSNAAWAGYKAHQNPDFFARMAAGQSPKILWLGCSDSRVPETTVLGLQPGDVFTHRNIANVISPSDMSVTAVLEFAINYLKVVHVVLCGHTCCGGAVAALGDDVLGGVLDTWIAPLRRLRAANRVHIEGDKGEVEPAVRAVRLAELNVKEGVKVLLSNLTVRKAIETRGLQVHGLVYDVGCGRLNDLRCGTDAGDRSETLGGSSVDKDVVRGQHGALEFDGDKVNMVVR